MENVTENRYHVVLDGKESGPYSFDELKILSLERDTLIWWSGIEDWIEAGKVESLKELFEKMPPPVPSSIKKPAQEILISAPINVNVKKVKSEQKPSKIDTSKIQSELEANLGMLLIAGLLTFLFYSIYSEYKRPEMIPFSKQIELTKKVDYDLENNSLFVGNTVALAGERTEYDYGLTLSDYKNINQIRMSRFKDDVKEKTIYCFIISLAVCVVGRYFVILLKK